MIIFKTSVSSFREHLTLPGNSSHYQGTAHTTREQFTPSAAGFFSAKSTDDTERKFDIFSLV